SRVFTRVWLALVGLWSWDELPVMPPELVLLPPWMPLNVYDWGCWARQTVVPLTIVGTHRPVRPVAFGIDELRTGARPPRRAGLAGLDGFLVREWTPDGTVRRLEACQSPVWDTGLALTALLDAGEPADDPAVVRAADWLLAEEIRVTGDWAVRRPGLAPGGW